MVIVGLSGFIGAGKGTAAQVLTKEFGFYEIAFADTLKDVLAVVFGWPRDLLRGDTPESRAWRDEVDPWWSQKLQIPNFTPRMAMQMVGTTVFRHHFSDAIWVSCLERKLENLQAQGFTRIAVSDVRFANEFRAVKNYGGVTIRVKKGPEPKWWATAVKANAGTVAAQQSMLDDHQVSESEWAWCGLPFDFVLHNDSTVAEYQAATRQLASRLVSTPAHAESPHPRS